LNELRLNIPLDTRHVILETLLPANRLSAHDSPLDVAQVKVVITTALC